MKPFQAILAFDENFPPFLETVNGPFSIVLETQNGTRLFSTFLKFMTWNGTYTWKEFYPCDVRVGSFYLEAPINNFVKGF
jgi:hypothetical protein